MGLYDSVNFSCPRCDDLIEVQSKAGKCVLASFPSDEVPLAIAADIAGEKHWCSKCSREWTVVSINAPPVVVMRLA